MGNYKLRTYKLSDLIEQTTETNFENKYKANDVVGMTITKEIIPTKANVDNTDLSKFLVIKPNEFVYNPRTHGKKIGLGFNSTDKTFIISWNNIGFRVKDSAKDILSPVFFFMYIRRDEWDRQACFNSWGSSTEVFSWDAFTSMEITLPSINTQKKYVAIYKAMQRNLAVYQSKVDDLKLVCDGFLDKLKNGNKKVKIGDYIEQSDLRNEEGLLKVENVKGITTSKQFIETKANMHEVNLKNYKVVNPNQFAYVSDTSRRGDKISLALNTSNESFLVSSITTIFKIINEKKLSPQYLMMFFSRNEFDRYSRYYSWGSAREAFDWNEMCNVEIPIPDLSIQNSIVQIYNSYQKRKAIAEKMKTQINSICPVLIKGAIKEGE